MSVLKNRNDQELSEANFEARLRYSSPSIYYARGQHKTVPVIRWINANMKIKYKIHYIAEEYTYT